MSEAERARDRIRAGAWELAVQLGRRDAVRFLKQVAEDITAQDWRGKP